MTPEHTESLIAGGGTLGGEFKGEKAPAFSEGDLVGPFVCLTARARTKDNAQKGPPHE